MAIETRRGCSLSFIEEVDVKPLPAYLLHRTLHAVKGRLHQAVLRGSCEGGACAMNDLHVATEAGEAIEKGLGAGGA